ncbi:transposase, partial [Paraburkholderia mimosarum]
MTPSERRRRRRYSEEFKARVLAACHGTGVSVAAVALEHRLNATLLRRWSDQAEGRMPKGCRAVLQMRNQQPCRHLCQLHWKPG